MEQLTKAEQQEVDYRQMIFPMRMFHRMTGECKVFFGLDEFLMQEKHYQSQKPERRGPGRPPKAE